jgi:hypothetical protein
VRRVALAPMISARRSISLGSMQHLEDTRVTPHASARAGESAWESPSADSQSSLHMPDASQPPVAPCAATTMANALGPQRYCRGSGSVQKGALDDTLYQYSVCVHSVYGKKAVIPHYLLHATCDFRNTYVRYNFALTPEKDCPVKHGSRRRRDEEAVPSQLASTPR